MSNTDAATSTLQRKVFLYIIKQILDADLSCSIAVVLTPVKVCTCSILQILKVYIKESIIEIKGHLSEHSLHFNALLKSKF